MSNRVPIPAAAATKQGVQIFLIIGPSVLMIKQRAAAPGVCNIRKNTQCGCGWVLGCLVFFSPPLRIFFCRSEMKYFFKTEICG